MSIIFKVLVAMALCLAALSAEATPNSEVYVTVQSDEPNLKYYEEQQAGFSIFEVLGSGYEGNLEVEAFFQDENTQITITDLSTHKYLQTPVLAYGPAQVIFNVYEMDPETRYILRTPKRTLLESFNVEFNVRYNDFIPPELAVIPEENAVFIDDMPFFQVDYTDNLAGVDTSTFQATIIDAMGTRTDVTSLFTVTSSFATIQFDELNKLPIGTFFFEFKIADYNENMATQTLRYEVEIPIPTTGFFTGQVLDNEGNPVEGAEVSIIAGGTLNVKTVATTNAEGKYRLSVGQGGEILLSATKSGWTSQSKWVSGEYGKDTAVATYVIKPLDANVTFIEKVLGGVGTNADGSVEFHVAPNSASDDIYLNITQAKSGDELPGPLPILSEFTFMGTMGPSGTTFSPAGKLRIKNELNFPPNTPIVVGMFNTATGVWEDSGSDGLVTNDGEFVEYDMPHFSSWDANQPVVPPVDQQPQAKTEQPDKAGNGCKVKGCRIDVDKGNLGIDYELPAIVRYGQEYKPVFTYWSQSAKPVVFASASQFFRYLSFGDHPDLIQVELSLGKLYKKIFYKGKGSIPSGDTVYSYRMMMEAKDLNGNYMPTGVYDFNIDIGNDYANSRFATALYFGAPPLTPLESITPEPVSLKYNVNSRAIVLNSRSSAFGKGWTMQGLERITESSANRVIWEDGTGEASMYTGIPIPPPTSAPSLIPARGIKATGKKETFTLKNVQTLENLNVTGMIEKDGALIVADCSKNSVYAVGVNGVISPIAGTGQEGFSGDNGAAINAKLSCPSSVYSTYDGGFLIADKGNRRIRKVSKKGIITTVAGNGQSGESPDGGKATTLAIGEPTFVSEDKLHSIHFIVGNRVRFVDPRGRLSTLVAEQDAYYKVALNQPTQITYDEKDNLTIVDKGNNRIVKIFLQSGDIRIIAGSTDVKGREKLTRSMDQAAGAKLLRPVSYVQDKKAQVAYILDEAGTIHILAHDGRLIKSGLKSRHNSLVLSRNVGLVGIKQNERDSSDIQYYISPAGDFATLIPNSGGWIRIQQDGKRSYFNNQGLLISKTTLDGKNESFAYDSKGRLVTWTIPSGESYTFSYDFMTGRLDEVTDPVGRVTQFTVNSQGQLTRIQNPEGKERVYTYSNADLLTSETDEEQKLHQYIYSDNGLIIQEIYPDGAVRELAPRAGIAQIGDMPAGQGTQDNPADMPIFENIYGAEKSTGGREWQYKTDKFGKIIESVDGLGRKTEINRDIHGQVISTTDPAGGSTSITYNSNGLPTMITDQMGRSQQYQYTTYGRISKITDALSRDTFFSYDNQGNVIEIVDPLARTTTMTYGAKSLLTKITDNLGNETTFTYNSNGQMITSTDALGKVTEYSYNDAGFMTQNKDALNRITSYQYDNLNRMTKIIDPMSGETTFTYSDTGLMTSVTDPKGQTTTYTHNARGLVASMTNAMGQTEFYTYDLDGLLISKKRYDGSVIQYSFDESKQLTRIGAPDAETKFNYDANGNMNWIWNKHSSINRGFYANGQLKIENQRGYNVAYDYTSVGQRSMMTANGNQTSYFYTGMDIVSQINSQINGQTYVWTRQLDELNRPIKDVLPNGIEVHRGFTALSQLASVNNYNPSASLISGFAYGYDDVGKRISKVENNSGTLPSGKVGISSITNSYSYDDLDRLIQATSPAESFSYDAVGNRQYASGTSYNVINQLLGDGWKYSFEYNLNGDMTKKTNTQTGQETNFIWNTMSQLMAMQVKESGNVTKEIFFKYDGLGRRIERQVVDYVDNSKSYGRRFFYDGDMIIEEQDLKGNVLARYMNGPAIDDPLLVVRSEGAFSFTKDGLGSITEVTKSNAVPIQKYRYSSYGVTTQELQENLPDKNIIENRYAYTGRELEDETGLYYYRARYYDPELGRFISEDPIGFNGGDLNVYAYIGNMPVSNVDPYGLDFRICSRPLNMSLPNVDPFKHYFIRMDDGSTISYGVDENGNPSELLEKASYKNEKCGGNIKTTKKENQMMKDWAKANYKKPYSPFGYNCKSFVGEVTTQPWRRGSGQ